MKLLTSESGNLTDFVSDRIQAPSAVKEKLMHFLTLEPGWNFGEGGSVSPRAVSVAMELVEIVARFSESPQVFPGNFGEVAIAVTRGEDSIEVIVNARGELEIHVEHGIGFNFQKVEIVENATPHDLISRLMRLGGLAWNLHGSLIQSTLTSSGDASQTFISSPRLANTRTPLMEREEYLFSTSSALAQTA